MNIRFTDTSVEFDEMDAFISGLLLNLPEAANADDEIAGRRIFPGLKSNDKAANAEWTEFVEPGMRDLFRSNLDIVAEDLKQVRTDEGISTLSVPVAHAAAWIHTLNQARLALGARHNVTEEDMESSRMPEDMARGLALLQIEIYGEILSVLLAGMDF